MVAQKGARMEPKRDQKRIKTEGQNDVEKQLLKTLLEPSWGDLGAFWRPSWGPKKCFRVGKTHTGAKLAFFIQISVQEAF